MIKNADQIFICTLTGDADGLPDLEIPVSTISGTIRSGSDSYLTVSFDGNRFDGGIADRPGGDIRIDVAAVDLVEIVDVAELLTVNLENIDLYDTAKKITRVLTGHKQETYGPKNVDISGSAIRERNTVGGKLKIRKSIDAIIKPGDTVIMPDISFLVGRVSFVCNEKNNYMDIYEE